MHQENCKTYCWLPTDCLVFAYLVFYILYYGFLSSYIPVFFSVLIIMKIFSGGLNTEDEEEMPSRKRRRSQSSSSDSINIVSPSAGTQTPRVTYSTAASSSSGMSPVKITISKSPQTRPQVTASSQAQKVRHDRFWHSVKKSLYR